MCNMPHFKVKCYKHFFGYFNALKTHGVLCPIGKRKIPNGSWRIKMWLYKCFWTILSSLYYTSIKRSSIFGFSFSREDCRVPAEGSRIHGNTDVQPHWNSIFWNQAKQVKSWIMLIRWLFTMYSKDLRYVQKWHF